VQEESYIHPDTPISVTLGCNKKFKPDTNPAHKFTPFEKVTDGMLGHIEEEHLMRGGNSAIPDPCDTGDEKKEGAGISILSVVIANSSRFLPQNSSLFPC